MPLLPDQLTILFDFLITLNIDTTVIVDSLDESNFFFNHDDSNLQTLQKFIDSVTDDEILHLALGNWGENNRQQNNVRFYIFIPETPKTQLKISWSRPDKIPIIDLKWDEIQLINYADYIFDFLQSKSRLSCQSIPDICKLLGGKELCTDTMKELRHPRDFHIFIDVLIQKMNSVCMERSPPFIAAAEDLKAALAETKKRRLQE